jgi:AcrR family transcriptional regulator
MSLELTERQLEIIEAAGKILITDGISGLTIKNLANAMKFSESAIYRHFKSKEDIIIKLLEILEDNISIRLPKEINEKNTAEVNLINVFKSQFHFFEENPHFIIAILSEGLFDETEKIQNAVIKIMTTKSKLLTAIIETGKKNGEFITSVSTPDLLHIIMGTFRIQMLKWKLLKLDINNEIEGNRMIEIVIRLIKI